MGKEFKHLQKKYLGKFLINRQGEKLKIIEVDMRIKDGVEMGWIVLTKEEWFYIDEVRLVK